MNVTQIFSQIVLFRRFRLHLHSQMHFRIAACAVLVAVFFLPHLASATVVRMQTNLGDIDIELYDDQAPKTVANFLRYAGRGDYSTNGFIHRSMAGFVIQGGGYAYSVVNNGLGMAATHIQQDSPVQNEPLFSNIRGTIAMAKIGGDPNSATSEWFFNLADNSANLDYQNGGFTVFGHVIAGMNVVDDIANVQVVDGRAINPAFGNLPLINYILPNPVQPANNLVQVTRIPNVTATRTLSGATSVFTADVDMIFSSSSTNDQATMASRLATFTQPMNKTILFNNGGILTFTMTGTLRQPPHIVTLLDGNGSPSTNYYAYGPTSDNHTPHWYDFSFDSVTGTGAEFVNGKILLHFVDGKRGDDDLDGTNGSITHTGISALAMDRPSAQPSSQAGGGCTITTTPSQPVRNGDWILISMFLIMVAVVRKRTINDRICRISND